MSARAFVSGVWHETNTFSAVATDLAAFRRYQFAEGETLFEVSAGTNTEIGGMLSVAGSCGLRLVPGLYAGAVPSGRVTSEAYDSLRTGMLGHLRAAAAVDGVLLALHGAFVAEGEDEADAGLVEAVRGAVGPDMPLVGTFDLHGNLTPRLVAAADLLIGYKTYPHHDMGLCGQQAARGLARILDAGHRPARAFRKLPFAPPPQVQVTDDEPAASIMALAAEMEARPDVWSVSVAWGFPYADIAGLGVGVLVYADTAEIAEALADRLSGEIWDRRAEFDAGLVSVAEAIDRSAETSGGPAILVEVSDNAGGGSPGDATFVLAELVARKAAGSVIVIWDPDASATACATGIGGGFAGNVGGKADRLHGGPVSIAGTVRFAGDVTYKRTGNYMTGQSVPLGQVAVVDADGVQVMLTTEKAMPFDNDHLRVVGIRPEAQRLIVVKSAIAWRPHFRPFAGAEFYLDTPGITTSNLERLGFAKRPRPLYPLER